MHMQLVPSTFSLLMKKKNIEEKKLRAALSFPFLYVIFNIS